MTISNRKAATAPVAAPSSQGNGHTCVSCPYPNPRCPHNSPWPRNDSPSTASSSNTETGGTASSSSAPSIAPANPISTPSAGSSPADAHDRAVRSTRSLRSPHTRRSLGSRLRQLPLSLRSISGTDTLAPTQHDTDNATAYVITFEICSLLPPYVRSCGNNSTSG